MMRKLYQLLLFGVVCIAEGITQSTGDISGQSGTSPNVSIDCSDPYQASSPQCIAAAQMGVAAGAQTQSAPSDRVPQLRTPFGGYESQIAPQTPNPSEAKHPNLPPTPQTEFQQMVADSAGRPLPLFGQSLFDQAPSTFAPMDYLQVHNDYIIGPGDVLDIFVWHNTDLSRRMPVRPDGRIAMPLLGDTVAVGKTAPQLAAEIQDKLRTFIRDPLVTVIPTQFVGTFTRQIRVIGEAARPQAIPFRSSMTMLDVMIEVGGLTRFAAGDRAVLVRQDKGEQKSYRIRLDSLVRDGDINQNVDMQPGDIVIIPQRYF